MACWPSCDTPESSARKTDPKEGWWPLPRRTAQDMNVFKDGMWPGAPRAETPVAGSPLVLTSTWRGRRHDGPWKARREGERALATISGWKVSWQRVGNAFGVRYGRSIRALHIEFPYVDSTLQTRQRPLKPATKPATLPRCRLTFQPAKE